MSSAVQFLIYWNKAESRDPRDFLPVFQHQFPQKPQTTCRVFDKFLDCGFSAISLARDSVIERQVAWNDNVFVLLSGTPHSEDHSPISAQDILARCYEGSSTLPKLMETIFGGFSVTAFFRKEQKLIISRDRFGLVPIFYSVSTPSHFQSLSVGSAPLTTARIQGSLELNHPFLERYIAFRYGEVFGHEATFLKNTFLLPPATILSADKNVSKTRYWSFSSFDEELWEDCPSLEDRCWDHLLACTNRTVLGDGSADSPDRTILALSSGLDSSSVAVACSKLDRPLSAFTARYEVDTPVNEHTLAQQIAENNCRDWRTIVIKPDEFLSSWREAYDIHEFPISTSSCLGYDILLKKVRELGFNRILTGGSGDDLFGGNYPSYLFHLVDLLHNQSASFQSELGAWIQNHGTKEFPKNASVFWDFLLKNIELSDYGRINPQPQLLSPELTRLERAGQAILSAPRISTKIGNYLHSFAAYGVWFSQKPPGILPLSEAAWHLDGEFLDPFIDEKYFQFAWKLPQDWLIRDGYNKIILRKMMKDHLPPSITQAAAKVGYDVPFQHWAQTSSYREFLVELFSSQEAREIDSIVDVIAIRQIVSGESPRSLPHMLLWQSTNAILWLQMLREPVF